MKALIFDCDGVLVETEKDGHRVAFNGAFQRMNIPVEWDAELYRELVNVAGGKERMKHYFNQHGWPEQYGDREKLIRDLHRLKTDLFMELIESGTMELRPGVARLFDEASEEKLLLAVCSTSNERAVNLIVEKLLGRKRRELLQVILAGDVVSRKKPDPEIYRLCAERLQVAPGECVVIEDNRNGLLAARNAGMRCVVTCNDYTKDEDFSEADLVVEELGDGSNIQVTVHDLMKLIK